MMLNTGACYSEVAGTIFLNMHKFLLVSGPDETTLSRQLAFQDVDEVHSRRSPINCPQKITGVQARSIHVYHHILHNRE